MEFLLQQQANFVAREAAAKERFDAQIDKINETLDRTVEIGERTRLELRRAVRLSVQEARAERKRRNEGDEKLAASHAALEASLQAFIESLKRGQNGHEKP